MDSSPQPSPVLLDEPATWPDATLRAVNDAAERVDGSAEVAVDLRFSEGEERRIEESLIGQRVRVYHCTRLLPNEREDVLAHGLRPASDALLKSRLAHAVEEGHLTVAERRTLAQSSMLAPAAGQRDIRVGLLHAVTVRDAFNDTGGLWRFFRFWGGEMLYFDQTPEMQQRLRQIGLPSIVVIDLPIWERPDDGWNPGIANVTVGKVLDLADAGGQVGQSTTAWPVTSIWQPGDPEYDQFPTLPQDL